MTKQEWRILNYVYHNSYYLLNDEEKLIYKKLKMEENNEK